MRRRRRAISAQRSQSGALAGPSGQALAEARQAELTRGHHATLPYDQIPAFVAELRERPAIAAGARILHPDGDA
jgi:hypothetical protein